ncbi:MAG: D-alanine--D-alanine ligase [Bacteroidales bacterium]|nr:D-alanine--D-alanine ligase [Bacteroidales bacterium]
MKKNIALVCGGYTGEYEISLESADQIYENLKENYNVYKIIITKQDWFFENNGEKISIDRNDFSLTLDSRKIVFDAAFIIVHGTPGENGLLQGYFDMLSIPYNTCSALTSAVTFDKVICNAVVKQSGIVKVADNTFINQDEELPTAEEILNKVSLPVFVKPSQGGSSLATFKVTDKEDLLPKIKEAFTVDNKVIVEEFIKGREFSCGVMTIEGKITALPLAEICPKTDFFDWKAKYKGLSEEKVPAPVDEATTLLIQKTSEKIYKHLHCKGVCRIDYILKEETGELYFLEVNTTPGQSKESIVPKQIRYMGKNVKWLYETQIADMLK